jgi:hypothetical protein
LFFHISTDEALVIKAASSLQTILEFRSSVDSLADLSLSALGNVVTVVLAQGVGVMVVPRTLINGRELRIKVFR